MEKLSMLRKVIGDKSDEYFKELMVKGGGSVDRAVDLHFTTVETSSQRNFLKRKLANEAVFVDLTEDHTMPCMNPLEFDVSVLTIEDSNPPLEVATKLKEKWPYMIGELITDVESTTSTSNCSFLSPGVILTCTAQKMGSSSPAKTRTKFPSIVRVSAPDTRGLKNRHIEAITFGRLTKDYAEFLSPLMNHGEIIVKATCREKPDTLRPFTKVRILLQVYLVSPRLLKLFASISSSAQTLGSMLSARQEVLKDAFFTLITKFHPTVAAVVKNNLTKISPALNAANNDEAGENDVEAVGSIKELSKGLKVLLRPHQVKAVSWMLEREAKKEETLSNPLWIPLKLCNISEDGEKYSDKFLYINLYTKQISELKPTIPDICQGGILADEMGLGKTISVLGLLVQSRIRSGIKEKPTLIVCPTSLVGQWKNEISEKVELNGSELKVLVYHSTNRNRTSIDLKKYDVVVTTYGIVAEDFQKLKDSPQKNINSRRLHINGCSTRVIEPSSSRRSRRQTKKVKYVTDEVETIIENKETDSESHLESEQSDESDNDHLAAYSPGLFGTEWFRIVLDEGHLIKNTKTNMFIGCNNLKTKGKSNKRWILTGTPLQNGLEDVFALVKFIRLQPWCNELWWKKIISDQLAQGKRDSVVSTVRHILNTGPMMLRRTKRTTKGFEVSLPEKIVDEVLLEFSKSEFDYYKQLLTRSIDEFNEYVRQGTARNRYAQIFTLLLRLRQTCNHPFLSFPIQKDDNGAKAQKHLLNKISVTLEHANEDEKATAYVRSQVATYLNKRTKIFADTEAVKQTGDGTECPVCFDIEMDDPVVTQCGHIMCRSCICDSLVYFSKSQCPICRNSVDPKDLISVSIPSNESFHSKDMLLKEMKNDSTKTSVKMTWLLNQLKQQRNFNQGREESESFTNMLLSNEDDDVQEAPIKVIIFSQWTTFFDLFQVLLDKEKLQFLRYDGSMSRSKRDHTVETFFSSTKYNVLLISLKAGALGLNLTCASVVYVVDPWFNPTVEEQAINRCHRMGQTRPVIIKRLYIKDTVEMQIKEMQKHKTQLAAETLEDDVGAAPSSTKRNAGISFEELVSFFKK